MDIFIKNKIENLMTLGLTPPSDPELIKIKDFYESCNLPGIFNDSELLSEIWQFARAKALVWQKYVNGKTCTAQELSSIIQLLNESLIWFDEAVKKNSMRALLAVCELNANMQLPINAYIRIDSYDRTKLDSLAATIEDLLKGFKMECAQQDGIPEHEKRMFQEYNQGLAENNFAKSYSLILGIERGGRGIHPHHLIGVLLKFLSLLSIDRFNSLLKAQTVPGIIIFLQSLDDDLKISIGQRTDCTSPWILFEIIRQSLPNRNSSLTPSVINELSQILIKLKNIGLDYYDQTIAFFYFDINFSRILGMTLIAFDNNELHRFVNKQVTFSVYDDNFESNDALFNFFRRFQNSISAPGFYKLCELIAKKWEVFYNSINCNQSELSLLNLHRKQYFNFILNHYLIEFTNPVDLASAIEKTSYSLLDIETTWVDNESIQKTMAKIRLSKLYYLSSVWQNKSLSIKNHKALRRVLIKLYRDKRLRLCIFDTQTLNDDMVNIFHNFQ